MLTSASGGVTLGYDPAMRLYQVAGGATTRFAYDGLDAVAEYDAANALQRRFVFGPGVDEPLLNYEGSGTANRSWLHADERGSVIAISDGSGNVTAIDRYDEFGKPQATNSGRFQYTGQMWLPELGLYHDKARAYAPHLGRFLQTDPIDVAGGINLYAYVGNDPVNSVDPWGLNDWNNPTCASGCRVTNDGTVVVTGSRSSMSSSYGDFHGLIGFGDSGRYLPRFPNLFPGGGGEAGNGVGGGGGSGDDSPPTCGNVNLVGSVDAGIFLGYGWGFTLGFNVNGDTGAISAFASARVGTGLGWIAGAGVGVSNSPPQRGFSNSCNLAIGLGQWGGSRSTASGGASLSVGGSAGPKFGFEKSNTQNLTETFDLVKRSETCQPR